MSSNNSLVGEKIEIGGVPITAKALQFLYDNGIFSFRRGPLTFDYQKMSGIWHVVHGEDCYVVTYNNKVCATKI
jgi:hypothetical protein